MNKKILFNCIGAGTGVLIGVGVSKLIRKKVDKLPVEERKETRNSMYDTAIFMGLILAILAVDSRVSNVRNICDINFAMNIWNSEIEDDDKKRLLLKVADVSSKKVQKCIFKMVDEMEAN